MIHPRKLRAIDEAAEQRGAEGNSRSEEESGARGKIQQIRFPPLKAFLILAPHPGEHWVKRDAQHRRQDVTELRNLHGGGVKAVDAGSQGFGYDQLIAAGVGGDRNGAQAEGQSLLHQGSKCRP